MENRNRLKWKLLNISLVPIIVMGIFFAFVEITIIKTTNESEIYSKLDGVCHQTRNGLEARYSDGGYRVEHGTFYVNNEKMDEMNAYIDSIKDCFGAEVTVFVEDKRAITTIVDEEGNRIVGSKQTDSEIVETVMNGEKYVSEDVIIYNRKYYGEYIPLYDDGKVVGMVFAGLPNDSFIDMIIRYYVAIIIFTLVTTVIVVLIVMQYSRRIAQDLENIKTYFGKLADRKDDDYEISESVLERNDEIGDLGRYAIEVGEQLRKMIGHDPLTGLYNRRSGLQYLGEMWQKANEGDMCTIVMCDIDFFKKVNDKYGHDMGDAVLVKITSMLDRYFGDKGYVIRWGGEEFVIGVPFSEHKTISMLEDLREDLKRSKFTHKDGDFYISMTFGVAVYKPDESLQSLINKADDKLYKGKAAGRDRIVC